MKRIADPKALQLLLEGTEALAVIEGNGIRVDVEYLDRAITETDRRIVEITESLKKEDIYRTWEKRFKHKANLDSRPQLAEILFDVMKIPYPVSDRTETGRYRTDGAVLQKVKIPFVQEYLKLTHLKKDRETYLGGIRREVVDGFFHASYNLHLASTFRSSSGADREDSRTERDLNFQNLPVRDPARAAMIRQAFIPREGCHLVEVDFSGIEVRIACAYNKDPNLKKYIEDPTTDMHRDTAMELFSLAVDQVEKRTTRDWTKNRFVFPEFYGSVYFQCAPHIWEVVVASEGKVPSADTTIRGWLEKQGIKELGECNPRGRPRPGTFEFRVKEVEELFWKKRFTVYDQWKKDWFAAYQKNGGFKTLTGFWIGAIGGKQGLLKRNDVNNYPIQGCLAGSSKVLTKKGLIPIKELVGVHTQVWTGFRWADAIGLDRGVCRRAIIRLSSGLVIRCDTRHKLKNENGEWICFDDLRVGGLVALPKIGDQIQPSKEMNWSFVFGFIIGDGCLRYERENLSIVVGKKKKPILESIRKFFLEQGYKDGGYRGVHWKIIPAKGNKAEKYALQIQNKELAAFLKSKGFDFSWKSKTKRIPASVWTSSVQEQRDFMEGLWLSDGTRVVGSEKNLNMTNLKLLKEVQILISTMGFDSYIDKNKMLRVCWREYKSKPKRKYPYTAIKRLVDKVDRKNYDDVCQHITDERNFKGGKSPSQYVGERIIERNSTGSEVYRFDSIVSIEVLPKEETTYTMTVNDPLHQFVADGVIHKNSAFHCLLWTLIQLTKEIRKRKMKTKVVGQIHDSVIADVPEREIQDYLEMSKRIMTVDLPKAWTWINVPLDTEAEVCPLGGSWHTKAVWEKVGGVWCPKKKK